MTEIQYHLPSSNSHRLQNSFSLSADTSSCICLGGWKLGKSLPKGYQQHALSICI